MLAALIAWVHGAAGSCAAALIVRSACQGLWSMLQHCTVKRSIQCSRLLGVPKGSAHLRMLKACMMSGVTAKTRL